MEGSPILELARSMRTAVERRTRAPQEVLDRYDEALERRVDAVADFLRTIHRADEAYDRSVAEAQHTFRQRFETHPRRRVEPVAPTPTSGGRHGAGAPRDSKAVVTP
jgi:aminoglycoside phosphotransferase (APT) family kinase protein